MHEIDLVGIDVDGDVGPELEIEPNSASLPRQHRLIGALGKIGGGPLDQFARHPIDMGAGLDPVVAAEQPGESGMGDLDVEPVRIIVGDVLPIDVARPHRDPADRLERLEAVGRHFRVIGRQHLRHGWSSALEPDEQEAAPGLQLDGNEAERSGIEPRIILPLRHGEEAPVRTIGPGVIGAGQAPGAARLAIDQPRAAMAADVGEGARRAVVATNHQDALAQYLQRPPFAGLGDVAGMADDLP